MKQCFLLVTGHEHVGEFKGMEIIFKELGLYKVGMAKDGGKYKVPELPMK
jgi:hypothetical protein